MRNYLRENMERYRRMARSGAPAEYAEFSSRGFLDDAIPRLRLHRERPRVLELGTGTGPGAIHLAERGFAVHAVDLIPEAIAQARRAAAARGFDVRFEVMDITRIPRHGPLYDLIVDSYCLQGIVLEADREAVFRAVKARLHPRGYYLVSSAMYAPSRQHFPPPALPGISGTPSLSATPPAQAGPRGFPVGAYTPPTGLPVLLLSPSSRMPSPIPRRNRSVPASLASRPLSAFPVLTAGRLPHYPFRGLLGVHSRCGLRAR